MMETMTFESGAKREVKDGRGRYDLIPMDIVEEVHEYATKNGVDDKTIIEVLSMALPKLAKHYENGAKVHGERNWEKGIKISSYVSSMWRHLIAYCAGETDEDHLTALIWNAMGASWTQERMPQMVDMPVRANVEELFAKKVYGRYA